MPKFKYNFRGTRPLLEIYVGATDARRKELSAIGQGVNGPNRLLATALLDTGASITVIDQSFVDRFKLAPTAPENLLSMGSLGSTPTNCYEACVTIVPTPLMVTEKPEEKTFYSLRVAARTLKKDVHGFNAIIGMDILKHSVLTYDGRQEVFTLDF